MRIFSGIRPTGHLHFGNYSGAISQWTELQEDKNNSGFFCVVDLHALVANPPPQNLTHDIIETTAGYLAFGLQDTKFHIFMQSHVAAHSELAWILNTITGLGELERMTQFKDKAGYKEIVAARDKVVARIKETVEELSILQAKSVGAHHRFVKESHRDAMENYKFLLDDLDNLQALLGGRKTVTRAALLNYPVLMASDILLYDTDTVPVGEDQKQHVELAHELAKRFNTRFGQTFTIPKAKLQKNGARIMSLQDPSKKMSKSLGEAHYLGLFEDKETIRKKIKSAVTDSDARVSYDREKKPAISNLLTILSIVTNASIEDTAKECESVSYAALKEKLADEYLKFFEPVRAKKEELGRDPHHVLFELKNGADKARIVAQKKLRDVQLKVGLI